MFKCLIGLYHTWFHQVQGNNKLKVGLKAKNRLLLREAIDFYNKALALKCSDTALNVALHNNKAHVNSLLGEAAALQQHGASVAEGCLGWAHQHEALP
jgi:hypothetical protein